MGQVYVEVMADVANNGIMALDSSGGGTSGSYWLRWTPEGGFTGTGWESAWSSSNVPLSNEWSSNPAEGYANTYDGFLSYVANIGDGNLNRWLDGAGWTNEEKYAFAHDEYPAVWYSCTAPV